MVDLLNMDEDLFKKHTITILHEDKENKVCWYSDTPIDDVREAILGACESMCDGEFDLLDFQAKKIEVAKFKEVKDGSIFFLRRNVQAKPNSGVKPKNSLDIDNKRKVLVQIPAIKHIESQVAIKCMLSGCNLLKHTYKGFPHIRLFQISQDLKRILWYTKSKPLTDSQVAIEAIQEIVFGQSSENFIRYPLPMLEEFSFSIYYHDKLSDEIQTLDLTCKDQREFDLWVIGIKALIAHFSSKQVCKNELLSHSKSYREQMAKGEIGNCSKFLVYSDDMNPKNKSKNLEKFISSRNISQSDMASLILRLSKKVKYQKNDIHDIMDEEKLEDNINSNRDYQELFADEAIADDTETQKNKMCNLFVECESNLIELLQEFLWYCNEHRMASKYDIGEDDYDDFQKTLNELEIHSNSFNANEFDSSKVNIEFFLKEMDIKLWKLEIDIENVGDIINRFKNPQPKGIFEKLKDFLG